MNRQSVLQEQETNQVRSIWIVQWAQRDAEQRLSARWSVDGEPIWVFSFQRRSTILLYPFWVSNYRHLKNVWIIFISTVIHLYVYAIHITWKYVGFCYKDQTLLVRFNNVNSDLKFPQQLAARGSKNLYYHGKRTERKLCNGTAMWLILFKLWRGIDLQFFSTCYLSYSYFSSFSI